MEKERKEEEPDGKGRIIPKKGKHANGMNGCVVITIKAIADRVIRLMFD